MRLIKKPRVCTNPMTTNALKVANETLARCCGWIQNGNHCVNRSMASGK